LSYLGNSSENNNVLNYTASMFPIDQGYESLLPASDAPQCPRTLTSVTVILPMTSNDDEKLLEAIDNKKNVTLFANAGCAYTCPSKICYPRK